MKCPRCQSENVRIMTKAPEDHAWEVYVCERCCFSWRSTETVKIHEKFLLDEEKIRRMETIPPVPPLESEK